MWRHLARLLIGCLIQALAFASFAQAPDVVGEIARENARLSAEAHDDAAALDRALEEVGNVRKAKRDLDARMQWVKRRAALNAHGEEFARTLNAYLSELPRPERFSMLVDRGADRLAEASDAELRVERALSELGDLDAATARRLAAAGSSTPADQLPELRSSLRAALEEQRGWLQRLAELKGKRLETLHDTETALHELEQAQQAARAELTARLFWIPAPPTRKALSSLGPALAWTVSPANWRQAAKTLQDGIVHWPFWPMASLVAAAAILALRRTLVRRLVALSPAAVTYDRYRIGHALAALAVTLALAIPIPAILWTAGTALTHAPESQPFPVALHGALLETAKVLLVLSTLVWVLHRDGLAPRHFSWDEVSLGATVSGLRKFAAVFVPLSFVAALNFLDDAPAANRESLGRVAFTLALLALVAFLVRLFRGDGLVMRRLRERAPSSRYVQLHAFWFAALVALPMAIAGLAAAGFFVAAGYFFARIVASVLVVMGAIVLYGVIALWVQVQRLHLGRRRQLKTAPVQEPSLAREAGSELTDARPPELDIAMLGDQTRSLLDVLGTLAFVGGIWWLWRDTWPALSVMFDQSLWNYSDTVNGVQVTRPVTVGNLAIAIVIGAVTAVVVRNIGALLDIVLLQRLNLQTDATYALKVIARYTVTSVGVVVAFSVLGLRWDDVQWLVAALGVGLGFGLQEIVANFVCGLIVLTERPIRIGDVVTVGTVSGKVSRIHARATVLVDFERKEVIIPNKAFITDRVTNWTLSDQTTRLLVKVGVAYGSDVALVQRLLLEAVRGNRDVLLDPSPSVFFVGFGDSALDFEMRAFVDSIDKRMRVTHELNYAIAEVLRDNGIEIPFPQRDLHIRSAPGVADAT